MQDMTKLMEANEQKQQEVDNERKEAVEKIHVLRDIIRDLEAQLEAKNETENELKNFAEQLEEIVRQQSKANDELTQQLSVYKNVPDAQQYQEHIETLEEELQKLRLNSELAGSEGALKQIKLQVTIYYLCNYCILFFNNFSCMKSKQISKKGH